MSDMAVYIDGYLSKIREWVECMDIRLDTPYPVTTTRAPAPAMVKNKRTSVENTHNILRGSQPSPSQQWVIFGRLISAVCPFHIL